MAKAVVPVRAFKDNYIWVLRAGNHAAVVDPGDAAPVIDYLQANRLQLTAILITHHHNDHIGGVPALFKSFTQQAGLEFDVSLETRGGSGLDFHLAEKLAEEAGVGPIPDPVPSVRGAA